MKKFLESNLNAKSTENVLKMVNRVIKGWINYHVISDNRHSVDQFLEKSKFLIHKWLNRRGGKKYVSWKKLMIILKASGFPKHWKTKSMFEAC